jgi:hypothetical protein
MRLTARGGKFMADKPNRSKAQQKKGGGLAGIVIVAMLGLGLGFVGYRYMFNAGNGSAFVRYRVPGGEHRPTLDPALFSGSVARAYQVAREIPEVLDQLYCHCNCIENAGHFSNLSCFVDRHAAG